MKRLFSKTFFRIFSPGYIYALIPYLVIIICLQTLFPFPEIREAIKYPNTICFSFLLILYGITRIPRFHPFSNKGYLMQLTLSPWETDKPLPNGPVHLCWIDAIILAFFMLLTFLFPVLHWTIPLIAFLAAMNLGLFLLFCAIGKNYLIWIYALFVPFIAYPHCNLNIALTGLICLTIFSQWKMCCHLKQFPWNTPWWTENAVENFKKEALRRRIIRWPFRELCSIKGKSNTLSQNILVTTLIMWWIHVISWFFIQFDPDVTAETITPYYIVPAILIPAIRLLVYIAGYCPPIGLFGRFRTGQLIIPGYDKALIAPIILALVSFFVPALLSKLEISKLITYELSLTLLLFLAIQLPPSHEQWHYTGQHHIINPRRQAHASR